MNIGSLTTPIIEIISLMETEFRAFAFLSDLPPPVTRVIEGIRELRLLGFGLHSYKLGDRSLYLVRKGKEKLITVVDMTRLTGSLLEDGAMMVVGMKTLGVVGAKVVATASIIGFVGMAIQTVSIGIDSFRIYQSIGELISLSKNKLNLRQDRRMSFMALYGLHRQGKWLDPKNRTKWRPGITDKIDDRDIKSISDATLETDSETNRKLQAHLKKRLWWGIAFRAMAIVAAAVGIAALAVLLFAPTPAAAVGWALVGTAVAISIIAIAAKVIVRWRQDKEFKRLDNNSSFMPNTTHETTSDPAERTGLCLSS